MPNDSRGKEEPLTRCVQCGPLVTSNANADVYLKEQGVGRHGHTLIFRTCSKRNAPSSLAKPTTFSQHFPLGQKDLGRFQLESSPRRQWHKTKGMNGMPPGETKFQRPAIPLAHKSFASFILSGGCSPCSCRHVDSCIRQDTVTVSRLRRGVSTCLLVFCRQQFLSCPSKRFKFGRQVRTIDTT